MFPPEIRIVDFFKLWDSSLTTSNVNFLSNLFFPSSEISYIIVLLPFFSSLQWKLKRIFLPYFSRHPLAVLVKALQCFLFILLILLLNSKKNPTSYPYMSVLYSIVWYGMVWYGLISMKFFLSWLWIKLQI